MRKSLIIETLYEVSIVFRKESFINAKKVLKFTQSLTNEKKVTKSLTALHTQRPIMQRLTYWKPDLSIRKQNSSHLQDLCNAFSTKDRAK